MKQASISDLLKILKNIKKLEFDNCYGDNYGAKNMLGTFEVDG